MASKGQSSVSIETFLAQKNAMLFALFYVPCICGQKPWGSKNPYL